MYVYCVQASGARVRVRVRCICASAQARKYLHYNHQLQQQQQSAWLWPVRNVDGSHPPPKKTGTHKHTPSVLCLLFRGVWWVH